MGDSLHKEQIPNGDAAHGEEKKSNEWTPLILFIKETSHLEKVIGKEFETKLGEELKIEVPFARIGKYDGNLVFNRNELSQENLNKLLEKGFEYNGQKVEFTLGNDKEREEFMRNHGRHVGKIILKSKLTDNKRVWKRNGKTFEGESEEKI